jgi:hypothetical protein
MFLKGLVAEDDKGPAQINLDRKALNSIDVDKKFTECSLV